jgi:hypothetical protein
LTYGLPQIAALTTASLPAIFVSGVAYLLLASWRLVKAGAMDAKASRSSTRLL